MESMQLKDGIVLFFPFVPAGYDGGNDDNEVRGREPLLISPLNSLFPSSSVNTPVSQTPFPLQLLGL